MSRAAGLLLLLLALPAAAQEPGWERDIRALAPALRACLADRPGAMVMEARLLDSSKVTARLLLADGTREECIADPVRAEVERRSPAAASGPEDGLRTFMLDRRCVDARRVDDENGRELGWLAYRGCG